MRFLTRVARPVMKDSVRPFARTAEKYLQWSGLHGTPSVHEYLGPQELSHFTHYCSLTSRHALDTTLTATQMRAAYVGLSKEIDANVSTFDKKGLMQVAEIFMRTSNSVQLNKDFPTYTEEEKAALGKAILHTLGRNVIKFETRSRMLELDEKAGIPEGHGYDRDLENIHVKNLKDYNDEFGPAIHRIIEKYDDPEKIIGASKRKRSEEKMKKDFAHENQLVTQESSAFAKHHSTPEIKDQRQLMSHFKEALLSRESKQVAEEKKSEETPSSHF